MSLSLEPTLRNLALAFIAKEFPLPCRPCVTPSYANSPPAANNAPPCELGQSRLSDRTLAREAVPV
jgi:hypothetical protein